MSKRTDTGKLLEGTVVHFADNSPSLHVDEVIEASDRWLTVKARRMTKDGQFYKVDMNTSRLRTFGWGIVEWEEL